MQIIAGAATTLTIGSNGGSGTFDGNIVNNAAALSIIKTGAGTQTFSGANTYTGTTRITGGTLALTNSLALGGSTLVWDNEGGSLDFGTLTAVTLGGLQGAQNLALLNNDPGTPAPFALTVGGGNTNTTYSGVLSSGTGVTKTGTGMLTLAGSSSNTYAGTTTLSGTGQLVLSKTGGAVAIPGNIDMSATGTRSTLSTTQNNQFASGAAMRFTVTPGDTRCELKGTTQTLAGLESTGFAGTYAAVQHSENGTPVQVGPISTLILDVAGDNPVTGLPYNFGNAAGTAVIRGQGGTLALVKNGLGKQILTGAGITYNGGSTINAGTLEFAANNNGLSGGMILNGGTVAHTGPGYLTVSGFLDVQATSIINVSNSGASNRLFFDSGVTGTGNLTINNTDTVPDATLPGVSFRNGTPGLFSGNLTVNGGNIATQGNGFVFQNANVTLNGANWMMDGTQFATTGANEQVKSLNGTGNMYIGVLSPDDRHQQWLRLVERLHQRHHRHRHQDRHRHPNVGRPKHLHRCHHRQRRHPPSRRGLRGRCQRGLRQELAGGDGQYRGCNPRPQRLRYPDRVLDRRWCHWRQCDPGLGLVDHRW